MSGVPLSRLPHRLDAWPSTLQRLLVQSRVIHARPQKDPWSHVGDVPVESHVPGGFELQSPSTIGWTSCGIALRAVTTASFPTGTELSGIALIWSLMTPTEISLLSHVGSQPNHKLEKDVRPARYAREPWLLSLRASLPRRKHLSA